MLKEIIDELNDLPPKVQFTRGLLKDLRNYRDKLNKEIQKSLGIVNYFEKEYPEASAGKAVNRIISDASRVLRENVVKAIASREEYQYPRFELALLAVVENPEVITILPQGVGWSTQIIVDIDLDPVAGTLEDWAAGVTSTREAFRAGKSPAERASELWRDKYYKGQTYDKIIRNRVDRSGKPAAFWRLLDQGTGVRLNSDRGGTPYPNSGPTNFVDKSKTKLERSFRIKLRESQARNNNRISELLREIELAITYLNEINILLSNIIEKPDPDLESARRASRAFEPTRSYIDRAKLTSVFYRIIRDVEVETTVEGRVEVTSPGAPRRYRPSLDRLQNFLRSV